MAQHIVDAEVRIGGAVRGDADTRGQRRTVGAGMGERLQPSQHVSEDFVARDMPGAGADSSAPRAAGGAL